MKEKRENKPPENTDSRTLELESGDERKRMLRKGEQEGLWR